MIDFTQIKTGEDFELLCEDLLRAMGYAVEASVSRGPDLGRDIIVSKMVTDEMGFTENYRYLIECKHYAKSGKSVRESDIGNPIARMGTHSCNRYILITSTVPSEKVRAQLAAVHNTVPGYKATSWAKNDLVRFLELHPDVWERHVGMTLVSGTPVQLLTSEVETWLQAMGYSVSGRRSLGVDQVEMVAEMDRGTIRQRLLIRCLDGEADVKRVGALGEAVQDRGFSEGWAIADRRVAPSARQLAESVPLRVFNLSEFMRLTFDPYFDTLTRLVEESRLLDYYVDLGCYKMVTDTNGNENEPEHYGVIDDYIDDWLRERGKMHISILGEFGTGKTWFCRHYAYRQLRRYLADPVHERLPLLITLRDFTKSMTAQQLINDALLEKYRLSLVGSAFEVFERMNRRGKLLLILDGFDEMARKVDYQTVVDNFWELASVVVEGSKVLLTSRTEYFRYARESEKILRGEEYGRATIVLEPPKFEVLYLESLSDTQIEEMIMRRVGGDDGPVAARYILDKPNLAELARKPVVVELMLAALDEVGVDRLTIPAQVYLYATNALLMRNIKSQRTFTSMADKIFFLCELAWEMISEGKPRIHYREIPERVGIWFGDKVAETELDHWDYDLRNQTMLRRTAAGEYEFSHKSLAEYFVAYKFAAELGCLIPEFVQAYGGSYDVSCPLPYAQRETVELANTFGALSLRDERMHTVCDFLTGMVGDSGRLWSVIEDTRDQTFETVRYTGGNAATLLNRLRENFSGRDLAGTLLRDADLENADLAFTNFKAADLQDANLIGAVLDGSDLRGADLRSTRFPVFGAFRVSERDGRKYLVSPLFYSVFGRSLHVIGGERREPRPRVWRAKIGGARGLDAIAPDGVSNLGDWLEESGAVED